VRLRTAIPLLAASFAVMLTGLGLAHAQQDDEPEDGDQDSPSGRELSDAVKRARERRRAILRGQTGNAQEAPSRRRNDDDEDEGDDAPPGSPEIEPFETGVDYRPTPPGARVTFNLEDADLPDLVRLISTITGRRFILPGKVRSIKASVFAPTKVTAAEAYQAFLSILELNGMTVVPSGRYLKIVETGGIENEPITTYTGESPTPRSDRYVTRLHEVDNISADDAAQLLSRFKSSEGNVTAYAPTNTLIITDLGTNIRRMLRILEAVDLPRTGEQIWIEPVYYANASEVAERLAEIFPVGERSSGSSASKSSSSARQRTARARAAARRRSSGGDSDGASTVGSRSSGSRISKILADERTNSLIILATEGAYVRVLELIRRLDVPLEGEGRIHVHYIQNGDAEEIAGTLQSLIGGGGGRSAASRSAGQRGAQASAAAASGGGDIFEGQIRITAHTPTNALVITSSVQDYAALRRVIERLDSPQRQVFIEAVIMELSVSRSNSLGLSFHVGAEGPVDGALALAGFQAGNTATPTLSPELLTGLALGVRGPDIPRSQELIGISVPGFGVAINALATSGDANVLSTPHIIALNNVQAEITVGENVPLQTSGIPTGALGGGLGALAGLGAAQGGQQGGLGGLAGAGLTGGLGIPRQDVGTTIRITPHINESDEIRLEIEEEISERGATEGTLGVVSITKRTATTELVVRDQQTVVIGGLMRDTVTTSEDKVPVLGDIPILGVLFRDTSTSTQKTNLLLFLTPYIIRGPEDLRSIYERKMRERQEFIDRYFVFGDQEYQPAIDYGRTRGLVSEIINEVDTVLEEEALLAEARSRPPPEHIPRPPVGEGVEAEEDLDEGDIIIAPDAPEPEAPEGDQDAREQDES